MDKMTYQIYVMTLEAKGITKEKMLDEFRQGKFICPQCLKTYKPKHPCKEAAFETQDLVSREQWLSHICSDACWNEFLGSPNNDEDEDAWR